MTGKSSIAPLFQSGAIKMILTMYFVCKREVIQKSLNQKSGKFGPQIKHTLLCGVGSQR